MTTTVDVYYHGIKIGTGEATQGSATLASYNDRNDGAGSDLDFVGFGRSATAAEKHVEAGSSVQGVNVQCVMFDSTHAGQFWKARTLDETANTLVLDMPCPFSTD